MARAIAGRFGLQWDHAAPGTLRHRANLFPLQLDRMLLWGEGLVEPMRCRSFLPEPAPTRAEPSLSGGSSEISKGHYYARFLRKDPDEMRALETASRRLLEGLPNVFPDRDQEELRERLQVQFGRGKTYGLEGLSLLDHFFLEERSCRWRAAHLAIDLFEDPVLPFVNVEHIQLAFALRPADRARHLFQTRIIETHEAELLRYPFNPEALPGHVLTWSKLAARLLPFPALREFTWADFFRGIGRPLVEQALVNDGPLWEILDREKARRYWAASLRQANMNIRYPLSLLTFTRWYEQYLS